MISQKGADYLVDSYRRGKREGKCCKGGVSWKRGGVLATYMGKKKGKQSDTGKGKGRVAGW